MKERSVTARWGEEVGKERTEKIRVELNVAALSRVLRGAGDGRVGEDLDGGVGCCGWCRAVRRSGRGEEGQVWLRIELECRKRVEAEEKAERWAGRWGKMTMARGS